MAIEGISPEIGLIASTKVESHWGRMIGSFSSRAVSPEHLAYFRDRLADEAVHPLDPTTFHVLNVAWEAMTFDADLHARVGRPFTYQAEYDGLRRWQEQSTPTLARFQDRPPMIVTPSTRTDPSQIAWDPSWEHIFWWAWSDEPFHTYHFRQPHSLGTLMAIGGFQAYNLIDPETEAVMRVDYDARQILHDTLFGGLILMSETPEALVDHLLHLLDTPMDTTRVDALLNVIEEAEQRGQLPRGRAQFFAEAAQRTGALSLLAFNAAYKVPFQQWQRGEISSALVQENLGWLHDPDQYALVRRLYQEGRIRSVQANVFDPESLHPVVQELRDRGQTVTTLYLSDPLDIVSEADYGRHARALEGLRLTLHQIPFAKDARLLWTQAHGVRHVFLHRNQLWEGLMGDHLVDPDPYDHYIYIEMPLAVARQWLAPPSPYHLGSPHGETSPQEAEAARGRFYFYRLNRMILRDGLWEEGKLYFPDQSLWRSEAYGHLPTTHTHYRALYEAVNLGEEHHERVQELLRHFMAEDPQHLPSLLMTFLHRYREVHGLTPRGINHQRTRHYGDYQATLYETSHPPVSLMSLVRLLVEDQVIPASHLLATAESSAGLAFGEMCRALTTAEIILLPHERARLRQALFLAEEASDPHRDRELLWDPVSRHVRQVRTARPLQHQERLPLRTIHERRREEQRHWRPRRG